MRYILDKNIALRSFLLVPYAYYVKGLKYAKGLKRDEYELLLKCDGKKEIDYSPLLLSLIERGLCHQAKDGDELSEWQREITCENRYFPAINWMITQRCNYNCLHCFNASRNNYLSSEFTLDEAKRLIEEARECGINCFTLTGGEPLIHPNFIEIVELIHESGMFVDEVNTNGFFITQGLLDNLKEIGSDPLMKISFDGVFHHDYLRNKRGAKESTLKAIETCISNGFRVKVQTNVHKLNVDTILESARYLDSMGVSEMRIIRTTESVRWLENSNNLTLSFKEYYDHMLSFLASVKDSDMRMDIDIWQFAYINCYLKQYRVSPIECPDGCYRSTIPVCKGNRGLISIGANGSLYPCLQASGYYDEHNMKLESVKEKPLKEILRSSRYLDEVCTTVDDLRRKNEKCNSCKYFKNCLGGCRAISLALNNDYLGSDLSKCIFFENDYVSQIKNILNEYTMISYR